MRTARVPDGIENRMNRRRVAVLMAQDEAGKPMLAPITVERTYRVGGKRVVCQVTFPAAIAKEIGLENMYLCAQRIIVRLESKETKIQDLKMGE